VIVTVGPRLIAEHAGRISVKGTPGMGTYFKLRLPLGVKAAGTA
jgi:chemotaxis protein histidine kinase CheA